MRNLLIAMHGVIYRKRRAPMEDLLDVLYAAIIVCVLAFAFYGYFR